MEAIYVDTEMWAGMQDRKETCWAVTQKKSRDKWKKKWLVKCKIKKMKHGNM